MDHKAPTFMLFLALVGPGCVADGTLAGESPAQAEDSDDWMDRIATEEEANAKSLDDVSVDDGEIDPESGQKKVDAKKLDKKLKQGVQRLSKRHGKTPKAIIDQVKCTPFGAGCGRGGVDSYSAEGGEVPAANGLNGIPNDVQKVLRKYNIVKLAIRRGKAKVSKENARKVDVYWNHGFFPNNGYVRSTVPINVRGCTQCEDAWGNRVADFTDFVQVPRDIRGAWAALNYFTQVRYNPVSGVQVFFPWRSDTGNLDFDLTITIGEGVGALSQVATPSIIPATPRTAVFSGTVDWNPTIRFP